MRQYGFLGMWQSVLLEIKPEISFQLQALNQPSGLVTNVNIFFFFQKALSERFKMDSQHIDLSSFYHEPKLRDHRVKLDYAYHAYIVAKIIVQNIPSVSV